MPKHQVRERRIVDGQVTVRDNGDGTVGLTGYASVYDSPAHGEVIRSSAFTRTLAQRDNVRFLVNHEGVPLASTRAGTMTLTSDSHGLRFDVPALDVTQNPKAAELVSAVRRGDLHQCSFAMTPLDDPKVDGIREIREAVLWDVSAVTFPWYEDTEVSVTDGAVGRALVALRSAPLEQATRDDVLRALRAAPPGRQSYSEIASALVDEIVARLESIGAVEPWVWLDDFGPGWAVYSQYVNAAGWQFWQTAWTDNGDGTVTVDGDPFEVEPITEYRPIPTADPAGSDDSTRSGMSTSEARALLGL